MTRFPEVAPSETLQIDLLGPPQITWRGQPFDLTRRQAQALLFTLAHTTELRGQIAVVSPSTRQKNSSGFSFLAASNASWYTFPSSLTLSRTMKSLSDPLSLTIRTEAPPCIPVHIPA